MVWFRARPDDDTIVGETLSGLVRSLVGHADCRIGARRNEDKPYRTWMLDAGPVDNDQFDALLTMLRIAVPATGIERLALAPPQFECFDWASTRCA
jgi:hypothetical protein